MNIKTLAAAAALAVCGAAGAATINLGTFDEDTSPLAFDHKQASVLANNVAFTDYVNFSLTSTNDASGSLTFVNNSKFSLSLDSWVLSKVGFGTIAADAGSTFADISYTGLSAGSYSLAIHGTLKKGFKGNTYGGNFVTQLSPVPEPETYALLLAGLGAVGFVVRRRQAA